MDKYTAGDVVKPSDYYAIHSAWIAPDGTMYYVEHCGHRHVAQTWGFQSTNRCERAGYIHLSYNMFVNYDIPRPTMAQVDTVLLYCQARSKAVPDWAVYPHEVIQPSSMCNSYRTGMTSRKMRDMFYPNSGD